MSFKIPGWMPHPQEPHLGWIPEVEAHAKGELSRAIAAGETTLRVHDPGLILFADDGRPLPEGFSLASMVKFPWNQGPVGSCFANAPPQAMQILTRVRIAAGALFESVELSRAFCWYMGRKLDGMLGHWGDGGSVTNAVRAMADYGCPPEKDWPYKASHSWLERTPPDSIFSEAKPNHVTEIAELADDEATRRALFNGHPVNDGIWWPSGWDDSIGPDGRATGIGRRGSYGHSLLRIGYATWDGQLWWQHLNSHGAIYRPLPPELAKSVVGYTPITGGSSDGRVYDFWTRHDWLQEVRGYGSAEAKIIAGVDGFKTNVVPWEDMLSWDLPV